MPSMVQQSTVPSLSPIAPKVPMKPTMTKLHIPTDQQKDIRVNQSLPPLPIAIPAAQESLAPGLPARHTAIRAASPNVSPVKPTRTMSHPVPAHLPIQLPPTVPEERNGSIEVAMSPVYRQQSGSSPILERNSANSRFSMRPRASTTNSIVRRNSRPFTGELGESPVDEEALRWTEEIRKKRESKRRWKEAEDEDRVIIGNKVDAGHPNYITAYNMLTGLRVAVSRVSAKINRDLTDEDFTFCQKFTFDYKGNELSPASKHDFRFKDYAPWVFRHLRALFHLDTADYLVSLTSRILLSELGSPGKSGSFFYFSRDYRFVIKTLHHAEHKYLRKTLRLYYEHVKANPNTLLSHFYGLHRVKCRGRKVHLVVINNVFPASKDIHQTFDLKGSTIGRDFDEDKLKENPRRPLKDLNWIRRGMHLELGPRKKELLLTQLKKDVELLSSLNIMDYSLLLGIHYVSRGNAENIRSSTLSVYHPRGGGLQRTLSKRMAREALYQPETRRLSASANAAAILPTEEFLERKHGLFTSEDGGFYATDIQDHATGDIIYYFGVIDLLTTYGMKKHLETWWKSCSHPRDQLSPIPPNEYAARFVKFIRASIKTREEVAQEKSEETSAVVVALSTIEEQEDRRIMEKARTQTRKEGESHGEKEELDVGRTTTLSPSEERPEQVLPSVMVAHNKQEHGSESEKKVQTDGTGGFTGRVIVRSPSPMEDEMMKSEMRLQEDGSFVKGQKEG